MIWGKREGCMCGCGNGCERMGEGGCEGVQVCHARPEILLFSAPA